MGMFNWVTIPASFNLRQSYLTGWQTKDAFPVGGLYCSRLVIDNFGGMTIWDDDGAGSDVVAARSVGISATGRFEIHDFSDVQAVNGWLSYDMYVACGAVVKVVNNTTQEVAWQRQVL